MWTVSSMGDSLVPHRDSITRIHQASVLSRLDRLDPIYLGGYPTALFLAPRQQGHLRPGLYSDHDIYGVDECHVRELEKGVAALPGARLTFENNKASTWWVRDENSTQDIQVQVIRFRTGWTTDLLNTFDIYNSAFGWLPQNKEIVFSKRALRLHQEKTLEILNPWMLSSENLEKNPGDLLIQVVRFYKYHCRWGLDLGPNISKLLLELYGKYPSVEIQEGAIYRLGSGSTSHKGKRTTNLWSAVAGMFTHSEWWDDTLDSHGYIAGVPVVIPEVVPDHLNNYFMTQEDLQAVERINREAIRQVNEFARGG